MFLDLEGLLPKNLEVEGVGFLSWELSWPLSEEDQIPVRDDAGPAAQ